MKWHICSEYLICNINEIPPERTSDFLFCESSVDSIAIDITSREFPRKTPPIPRNRARVQRRIQLPRSVQE